MATATVTPRGTDAGIGYVPMFAAAAALGVLYRDVVVRLLHAWVNDPNYSHGFVIVPVAGYLLWKRRSAFAGHPGSYAGIAGMAACFALLVAGELGAELFLTRVSLVGMVGSIILLATGRPGLRAAAFPLVLLLLSIPVPAIVFNQIAFPLQLLASQVGQAMLEAARIPVLREGNVIVLSTLTLEVAEACSGIRSLTSLVCLSMVYGMFTHTRRAPRAALIVASIPIAIVANAARVAGTGAAAYYFGRVAAEGFPHVFSGWVTFLVALTMVLAFDVVVLRRLARRRAAAATREVGA